MREEKFNQHFFLAAIEPELSEQSSNDKRRVNKKELIVHIDNCMCHDGPKIQEYFAGHKRREPSSLFPRAVTV
jgi:hypothetical protein